MDSPSRNDVNRAVSEYHDYILVYARDKFESGLLQMSKEEILEAYPLHLLDGRLARRRQLRKNGKGARREDRPTLWFPLTAPDGSAVYPVAPEGWEGRWVLSEDTWKAREKLGLTEWIKRDTGWTPYYIEIAPEEPSIPWPTIWTDVDQNRQAKAEFTELMGSGVVFENPKPTNLIENILRMSTKSNDIVVDFFAGSATTAQAALELNREDGGNRKFILVQLPEPIPSPQPSPQKGEGGFATIAEIGKERIRRVIKKMKKEREGQMPLDKPEDLGFKVFKLRESNYRQWDENEEKDPKAYAKQMEMLADPLVKGWKEEDVIYEVAVKEGFGLNIEIDPKGFENPSGLHRVTDPDKGQSFYISLADKVKLKDLKSLNLKKDDLLICRDIALDDETAANLSLQCRLKTI